jgi:hypothetical protein
VQLFMKRLRKYYTGKSIRFYLCGEYGDKTGRPHYHILLFGHDFADKKLYSENRGNKLYTSETLESLWPYGHCPIGQVTEQSAAYVARYIMKKINGDMAEDHYHAVDSETGEITKIKPEFSTMSRRPGIGSKWFEQNHHDLYSRGYYVDSNGKKYKIPKYYDKMLEEFDQFKFLDVKEKREELAELFEENHSPDRLHAKEMILQSKIEKLNREI